MKLLIATTNRGKLREIRELLSGVGVDLVTVDSWPQVAAPVEHGSSFAENARDKARYYALQTGLSTVAEDSGLEIEALGGEPGVRSSRFGGISTSYPVKFRLLYERLAAAGATESPARFVCAVALAEGDRIVFETLATLEGRIAPEPKGEGGFGYDPIFFYPPLGRTLAEAGDAKQQVSHRGEAFRRLRTFLEQRAKA